MDRESALGFDRLIDDCIRRICGKDRGNHPKDREREMREREGSKMKEKREE